LPFGTHPSFPVEPEWISGAQPDEVEKLVDEDSRKLRLAAIEGNPPFAQETASMDRAMPVTQFSRGLQTDGGSAHRRQPLEDRPNGGSARWIFH
jgi:hypothetical protein